MSAPCLRLRTALFTGLTAALLALVPIAGAGTAADDVASLNAKRAANGIPADIAINPDWSARCAQHNEYMRVTNTVSHGEDPASSAFTTGGDWAGRNSVLASGAVWSASNFIWEGAPLHLAQLLAPQLAQVGIADDNRFVCMTTWPGFTRDEPATNRVVTYPGNGASIYSSITTEEWPTTPARALGLPDTTGPHLYVYQWGPSGGFSANGAPLAIRSASVTGPSGPVDLRWVDRTNATVGQYLPTSSAILIPVSPLEQNATYLAKATFTNGVAYAWTFTTRASSTTALRNVRVVVQRKLVRRTCARRATFCLRWKRSYARTLRVTGNLQQSATGAGVASPVTIRFAGTTATTATDGSGAFAASYRVGSSLRAHTLVQVDAGDASGAYLTP